jgi:FAD/FMN-containing dehydrogenase
MTTVSPADALRDAFAGEDNLISAEVVPADGGVVRASAEEHPDLFWGARGGGGNFGIVTEFEFRLHRLGPIVLAGLMMFPIERAPQLHARGRPRPRRL